jgi:hypothetical protein
MPRSMVGLLAAVGTVMSELLAYAHGDLSYVTIGASSLAMGMASCFALPSKKMASMLLTPHIILT